MPQSERERRLNGRLGRGNVYLNRGRVVTAQDAAEGRGRVLTINFVDRRVIEDALAQAETVEEAARMLGITVETYRGELKRYKIPK